METQSEVYGEPLRLGIVHQRDAVEAVAECGLDVVEGISRPFHKELLARAVVHDGLHRGHGNAFLVGLSVVVLLFDLEKGVLRVQIGPDAHFRAGSVAAKVRSEHLVPFRPVPVGGLVGTDALAVGLLRVVTALRHTEQFHERGHIGHEFSVRPVHQPDGGHVFERNGRQFTYQAIEYGFAFFHSRSKFRVKKTRAQIFCGKIRPNGRLCLCIRPFMPFSARPRGMTRHSAGPRGRTGRRRLTFLTSITLKSVNRCGLRARERHFFSRRRRVRRSRRHVVFRRLLLIFSTCHVVCPCNGPVCTKKGGTRPPLLFPFHKDTTFSGEKQIVLKCSARTGARCRRHLFRSQRPECQYDAK